MIMYLITVNIVPSFLGPKCHLGLVWDWILVKMNLN